MYVCIQSSKAMIINYVCIIFLTAGMDYNVTASVFNVTISAGTISSSFNIDILDDVIHEDNETLNIAIKLVPTTLQLTLCISSSTVTIIDHDGTY